MSLIGYKGARRVPFFSQCSVNAEIVGGGHVNHEASSPTHPFLACAGASESLAVHEGHGSVQVVHMAHRGRGDTVAKWCRMALRLVRVMQMA